MEAVTLALVIVVLFILIVKPLLQKSTKPRVAVWAINDVRLQDLLVKREGFIGGVVIFTEGSSQMQIGGRVTGISLGKSGQNDEKRDLKIYTNIPFQAEARRDKEAGKSFHSKEISLYDVQSQEGYLFGFDEEQGVFTILHGKDGRSDRYLVTLVTKEKSDEFLKWRKKYHDEYAQNTLGW